MGEVVTASLFFALINLSPPTIDRFFLRYLTRIKTKRDMKQTTILLLSLLLSVSAVPAQSQQRDQPLCFGYGSVVDEHRLWYGIYCG